MEFPQNLTFDIYLAILFVVATLLWVNRSRKIHMNARIHEEALETGMVTPPSLYPVIDHTRRIGCEACVHACPEFPAHKVLGVMHNKAHLISPTDCIGHGACKAACPEDAITLVFGTAERGVDIPKVEPTFETNVPGIYIAGELGGMGLIRNATEQGRQAMENLKKSKRLSLPGDPGIYDVMIIGAGPAGLTATLSAHESKLNYRTIEQDSLGGTVAHFPRGKLVMTKPAVLPIVGEIPFTETDKETLMSFWTKVEKDTGIKIHYRERATEIVNQKDLFRVRTNKGSYQTRTLLLALGRRGTPRQLGVDGESLPKVTYRLEDPAEYVGKKVLVVGGGDSALEAAISIAEEANTEVAISYRSEAFTRAKAKNRQRLEDAANQHKLSVFLSSNVKTITRDAVELKTGGASDETLSLENDAVIVCAGGILPTEFLRKSGVLVETKYGTQ